MRLKILLWTKHPGDLLGEAIDFLTHGNAQHAAFQDLDGSIMEAYWPKLRRRALVDSEKQYIRAFVIRGITPHQEQPISESLADDLTHPPEYSGWDLIRYLFNKPEANENSTFCSRYVQHTCEAVLTDDFWPLIRCEEKDWVSPRDLLISNMLVEVPLE